MSKDSNLLPKPALQANEQPPRTSSMGADPKNFPGKQKGEKMPHETFNDKMAKGLGC